MQDDKMFERLQEFFNYEGHTVDKNGDFDDDYIRSEFHVHQDNARSKVTNPNIISSLKISPDEENVRIFDEHPNGLQLVHYLPSENFSETDKIRGYIYEISEDNVKLVAKSFPRTLEYVYNSQSQASVQDLKQIIENFNPSYASIAHEGTIMRIFWSVNCQQWFYSTHRKIDGTRSRWSGESFGRIFKRILPNFEENNLNKDYCYVILIEDDGTNLVCKSNESCVYHLITYDMTTGDIVKPLTTIGNLPERELHKNDISIETLFKMIEDCDPRKQCGIVLRNDNGEYIKILNKNYYLMRCLRGNEPNTNIRYLQVSVLGLKNELRSILHKDIKKFDELEGWLPKIPEYLGHLWYFRQYKGNFLKIDMKCYETMRSAGIWQELEKYTRHFDINLVHIKDLFITGCRRIQNARHINNIVKLMKNEYQQYHDTQKEWSSLFD